MLAAYITWHLRKALTPLTFTDEHIPDREDPAAPARRSTEANTKDAGKQTPNGLPVRSYQNLLAHLRTLNRETINFAGQRIQKITDPTPSQRHAFTLIGAPSPSPWPTSSHQQHPSPAQNPSPTTHRPVQDHVSSV